MPITSLTYRTADSTRWGGGNGSDLSAVQIDLNFWDIYEAIKALEDAQVLTVSIDFITQPENGNQFYITLTNHTVLGPFTIPTSNWNPRGFWLPNVSYAPFDTVGHNGNLYLVTLAHTSASVFSPTATDGFGHALYVLILGAPPDVLPFDGVVGQRLVFVGGSPTFAAWQNEYRNLALYISGQPQAGVVLFQYCCTEDMFFPVGLEGSVAFAAIETQTTVSYPIFKNGNAIGAIIFNGPSPDSIDVQFVEQVNFVPGDVITMNGPASPDAHQAGISFTLQATLTI